MLSKSNLQSYLQCPRKLWLELHSPELADLDDSSTRRREIDGNLVGERARSQLGKDFIWPPSRDSHAAAADEAKSLLAASPDLSAAEVPMVADEVFARADALVREKGGYALRETKSSTFPLKPDKTTPGKPDDHHLNDLAIQAWVMSQSGLPMTRAELNLLNNRWRYPGGGDYSGLFRQLEVTAEISALRGKVPTWAEEAKKVVAGEIPDTRTGKHCREPYECQFQGHCSKLDPSSIEHPIELLPDAPGKALAKALRQTKGYTSILEPKAEELTGKQADLYRRIQEAHRTGKALLEPGSADIMKAFPYPRYYFDFEGIDLAVPRWVGVRPYEQIPFQWSCHVERAQGVFEHREFLDLSGSDPSLPCIDALREAIKPDDGGPIFVYYVTYEKGRLTELAERHPAHAELLQKYIGRLVDLFPIVKQHFYHPAMKGSFSIKKVLPVVAPDLDYGKLTGVNEGTGAQVAYIDAALNSKVSAKRKDEIESQLRTYCRQDTWAMVELAYFLAQAGRPARPAEGE